MWFVGSSVRLGLKQSWGHIPAHQENCGTLIISGTSHLPRKLYYFGTVTSEIYCCSPPLRSENRKSTVRAHISRSKEEQGCPTVQNVKYVLQVQFSHTKKSETPVCPSDMACDGAESRLPLLNQSTLCSLNKGALSCSFCCGTRLSPC